MRVQRSRELLADAHRLTVELRDYSEGPHCLVLDGVYRSGADGLPTFVQAGAPSDDELHALLHTVIVQLMFAAILRTCHLFRTMATAGPGAMRPARPVGGRASLHAAITSKFQAHCLGSPASTI